MKTSPFYFFNSNSAAICSYSNEREGPVPVSTHTTTVATICFSGLIQVQTSLDQLAAGYQGEVPEIISQKQLIARSIHGYRQG